MDRKERLAAVKVARTQEKAIIGKLKATVNDMADLCALDEEKIARRVAVAMKSEYGRINGMINLVAAIAKWPAEQGDGASVAVNQALLESELGLDLLLLEDISSYKGFHTFHTDELEIIDGIAPDYDNYSDHCTILLEEVGFERASAEINPARWASVETRAKAKAADEITELKAAVEKHKALIS